MKKKNQRRRKYKKLNEDLTNALYSIKNNFTFKYMKKVLLKYADELDLNINSIDILVENFIKKGKPEGNFQNDGTHQEKDIVIVLNVFLIPY